MNKSYNNRTIGEFIKLRREKLGLTQQDLALKSGVHQTSISKTEDGVSSPRPPLLEKLAAVLKVPRHALLTIRNNQIHDLAGYDDVIDEFWDRYITPSAIAETEKPKISIAARASNSIDLRAMLQAFPENIDFVLDGDTFCNQQDILDAVKIFIANKKNR